MVVLAKGPADADGDVALDEADAGDKVALNEADADDDRDAADDPTLDEADAVDLVVDLVEWCRFRCILRVEFWAVAYSQ